MVNAFGDVYDPSTGAKAAGVRKSPESLELADTVPEIVKLPCYGGFVPTQNTIVGVVATNAKLNKTQLTKVAQMSHDGLGRTVFPVHTQFDGDTIFALSCGDIEGADVSHIGTLAVMATTEAVLRAVRKAKGIGGVPAVADLGL